LPIEIVLSMANSDTEWEKIGGSEPYWGVLTTEEYKRKNLTPASRQEFFNSGEEYVKQIFEIISSYIDRDFNPSLGIDFGCGVGRIAIPLSKRCKQVIGVDVSPSMVAEAKRNCVLFNITNIDFVDDLSKIKQKVDFINTVLVLQHIETNRGTNIIEDFVEKLTPSGIACIQVPYSIERSPIKSVLKSIVDKSSLAQKMYNIMMKKDVNAPIIMMNDYDITRILKLLAKKNINKIFILTEKYDKNSRVFNASLFIKK